MNQQTVLLQMPEALYERVREVAKISNRPFDRVLLDSLTLVFGDLPGEAEVTPDVLNSFADDQLWAIVYRPLAWPQDARLRELTALSKVGKLADDEQVEMERLIDQIDRYVLLRSQALLLLKQRGHDPIRTIIAATQHYVKSGKLPPLPPKSTSFG